MSKKSKNICIGIVILTIIIIIATTTIYLITKPHRELLGSWILTEEPTQNVKTISVLYFYGFDNVKCDVFVNLDRTGNDKMDEIIGKYNIDKKNKKIKITYENGSTIEISYINNDKMQLISNEGKEYTFVSNETSKALEEVFSIRNEITKSEE